ncbi:MAG TPA: hypothetical protein VGF37_04530 [Chthoniobacterales bacterium]
MNWLIKFIAPTVGTGNRRTEKQPTGPPRSVAMKMGRRLRDVGEASSVCPPGRSKARRFAYAALPTAHFDRNNTHAFSGTGH